MGCGAVFQPFELVGDINAVNGEAARFLFGGVRWGGGGLLTNFASFGVIENRGRARVSI